MKPVRPSWLNSLAGIEVFLLLAAISIIVVLAFLQIVLRNFWDVALFWIDPLTRHLVLVITFMGGARAADRSSHLSIDILTPILSKRARQWIKIPVHILAAAICIVLGWAGWQFAIMFLQTGDGSALTRPILWIIPAGFWLMACHFLLNIRYGARKDGAC